MYRSLTITFIAGLALCCCKPTKRTAHTNNKDGDEPPTAQQGPTDTPNATEPSPDPAAEPAQETDAPSADPSACLLTVDVTEQDFNRLKPWEKAQPTRGQISGVYLGDGKVLTHGAPLKAATYVEIGLPDGSRAVPARVAKYDPALRLGLLTVLHDEDTDIFASRQAYALGEPLQRGDSAELWCTLQGTEPLRVPLQAESGTVDDGMPRLSMRADQAVPSGFFMGAPIMKDGKLSGISAGYNQQARKLLSINAELIKRFLEEENVAAGAPVLGISHTPLTDPVFRRYLKLRDEQTGVYIGSVEPGSSAAAAGVQAGDVLTSLDGLPIDNQGRCSLPLYGQLGLSAVSRYLKPLGEKVTLGLNRAGEDLTVEATLNRDAVEKALMAEEKPGEAPRYVVWGGLVFQPLTSTYIATLKEQAKNTLPYEFLELENRKEELAARGYKELVGLTVVVPTPATLGYDSLGFCFVEKVNGKEAHSFAEFAALLDEPTADGLVSLSINKMPYTIYMDRATAEACNDLLRRNAIPRLRQMGEKRQQASEN